MLGSRGGYLVNVSVCGRLFWAVSLGYLASMFLREPLVRWEAFIIFALGLGIATLSLMAFIAALRLLWLKTTLIFWH